MLRRLPNFISISVVLLVRKKHFQFFHSSICICGLRLAECYPNIWDVHLREIPSMHYDESKRAPAFSKYRVKLLLIWRTGLKRTRVIEYDRESERGGEVWVELIINWRELKFHIRNFIRELRIMLRERNY